MKSGLAIGFNVGWNAERSGQNYVALLCGIDLPCHRCADCVGECGLRDVMEGVLEVIKLWF